VVRFCPFFFFLVVVAAFDPSGFGVLKKEKQRKEWL
jgi:hypothetical protein